MSDDTDDHMWLEPIPPWAERRSSMGQIEPMLQLCTRDGTKVGNATVAYISRISMIPSDMEKSGYGVTPFVWVVTDANSWMCLNPEEIMELFTLGRWIMNEFPNPLSDNGNPHVSE